MSTGVGFIAQWILQLENRLGYCVKNLHFCRIVFNFFVLNFARLLIEIKMYQTFFTSYAESSNEMYTVQGGPKKEAFIPNDINESY